MSWSLALVVVTGMICMTVVGFAVMDRRRPASRVLRLDEDQINSLATKIGRILKGS